MIIFNSLQDLSRNRDRIPDHFYQMYLTQKYLDQVLDQVLETRSNSSYIISAHGEDLVQIGIERFGSIERIELMDIHIQRITEMPLMLGMKFSAFCLACIGCTLWLFT